MTGAPPHLLMTADAVGGVWTYALDLAQALARLGVRTTLTVLGPAPTAEQIVAAQGDGVEVVVLPATLDWMAQDEAEIADASQQVLALAERSGADLVQLNSPALATSSFNAPVLGACHSCLATWWDAAGDGEMPDDFLWRTDALRRGLTVCDDLIAPTQAHADAMARTYDVPAPLAIHNGRRPAHLPVLPSERFAFTAGRLWDGGKNIGALDAAARRLSIPFKAAGPLTGPGGERTALHAAQALGSLTAAEVAAHLARRPIFVSAALYEPFGLSVLEAAQAGCPLVLADTATFRELWDGAAVFIDPRDPDAIATAVEGLAGDDAAFNSLARSAQARAARYTVERMAARTLSLYATLSPAFASLQRAAA